MFDLQAFSKTNRTRCESPTGFNHALESWSVSDWMTAAIGEVGEAANIVKKLNRYRDGIPGNDKSEEELRAALGKEIADAAIYLDLLAQRVGFDLSQLIQAKFDETSRKIGWTPMESTESTTTQDRSERMSAFIEATCPQCDGPIGWFGQMVDRPKCPVCGHSYTQETLRNLDAKMHEAEAKLLDALGNSPGRELRKQRNVAGMTLFDAATAVGVTLTQFSAWERNEGEMTTEQRHKWEAAIAAAEGKS